MYFSYVYCMCERDFERFELKLYCGWCISAQESFWVWAQPMRDDVILQRRLSLAGPIPKIDLWCHIKFPPGGVDLYAGSMQLLLKDKILKSFYKQHFHISLVDSR